ncbi:tryptophan synthase, alpha chain [Actinokineospora alba]|uniref:Tryptophan synthase alpha chain n=1 Tax=Actinokineospora alba TaxID=504798 RepID=A0A1H0QXX7_9PSEU|nr:tryptophan synthase subunit alpha [Actinokineospora alba]TDP70363.1 tryptophan synthase alpha chain [Actinokineospora alba]SDI33265.1 tryptophan synthase, alpha chain [Actinokineospora alba]SDP21616.1 tryptophan synthase, alpha chain [Actinokineospora alba]
MNTLEDQLRSARDRGRKLLVPYVTGGVTDDWTRYLTAYQDAGADAVEIGLPFSDPMLDGGTIQQASDRALARGTTAHRILADLAEIDLTVPRVVMTYANLVLRQGAETFCRKLRDAGVRGLIVPDLQLGEVGEVEGAAAAAGVDLVLLAAPSTPPARLREIGARSRGFVYAVSVMGTTGERDKFADSGVALARALKAVTDLPVLLGFGVSRPAHAVQACRAADGVAVGAALMRRVLDGAGPAEVGADVDAMRTELDRSADEPTGPT